jgi:hypothetical protein
MPRSDSVTPDGLAYVGADFVCEEATTGARGPTDRTAMRSETSERVARRHDAE